MSHAYQVPQEYIRNAAADVAGALGTKVPYAVVGGSACLLLGGHRATVDVDFVVPAGSTKTARQLLKNAGTFTVEPRVNHTKHSATNVDIDILTPPKLFQGEFNSETPTVTVNSVRVLHPLALLNAKVGSILGRSSDAKKLTDAIDIAFLLDYCAREGIKIRAVDVPNAKAEMVVYLIQQMYVSKELWQSAGYDLNRTLIT